MLFRLGSTTKMFTATALVGLAEEGRVRLDQPIANSVSGLHPRVAGVTPHQLLTHTSGILDEAPMYGSQDDDALAKEVRSWKEDRFFTEPGEIYSYSNPGFWLAGFVVQEVSGKPYADAMLERVFTPLGMTHTTLRPTMAMTYPLAQGHDFSTAKGPFVVRPHANNAASWPAGSIFSNVNDLSHFVIAFMSGGTLDGKQVLSSAVIEKLSTPYVDTPGAPGSKYGYGLTIRDFRGMHMVEHGGSRTGYGSLIWMVPDKRFAVIILANRSGASLDKTAEKAMEMFLPLTPKPAPKTPVEMPISEADTAAWVGTYQNAPAEKIEIFLKDGKLLLRRGNSELPIRKTGENQISAGVPGNSRQAQFTIVHGKDGRTFYLHSGGRAFRKAATGAPI
jgi:CubicO group peptidase (beta-lactamase class C family)